MCIVNYPTKYIYDQKASTEKYFICCNSHLINYFKALKKYAYFPKILEIKIKACIPTYFSGKKSMENKIVILWYLISHNMIVCAK